MATYPQYLFYGVTGLTNPVGQPHNFVTDSSQLSVNLGIEMPFNLKVGQYILIDTTQQFSLAQIDSNHVSQVILNTTFINGMPFDLNSQVFLCDSNLKIIDSLFTYTQQPIVKSAIINTSGKVTTATQTSIPIVYNTTARLQKLKNVRRIISKTIVSTTGKGQKFVKFYSYYRLSFKLGVEASFKVTQKL
jgi:hypothetical protein